MKIPFLFTNKCGIRVKKKDPKKSVDNSLHVCFSKW